jgi:hypothetical protein
VPISTQVLVKVLGRRDENIHHEQENTIPVKEMLQLSNNQVHQLKTTTSKQPAFSTIRHRISRGNVVDHHHRKIYR